MTEDQKSILRNAVLKWGVDAQMKMAIEETSELQKAICKLWRSKPDEEKSKIFDLLGEIADVEIMCYQLRMMFDEHNQVDGIKEIKINRVRNRLNNTKP